MASRSSISDTLPWIKRQCQRLRLIRGGRKSSQALRQIPLLTEGQKLVKQLGKFGGDLYDLTSGRLNDLLEFLDGPVFEGVLYRALYFDKNLFDDREKIIDAYDHGSWNRLDQHHPLTRFSGLMHLVVGDSLENGVGLLRQPKNNTLRFSPASFERISVIPSTPQKTAMFIPRDIQYVNFASQVSVPVFASKLTILTLPIIKVFGEGEKAVVLNLGALFVVWEKDISEAKLDQMRMLANLLAERITV